MSVKTGVPTIMKFCTHTLSLIQWRSITNLFNSSISDYTDYIGVGSTNGEQITNSLIYKITNNLISILISESLIPLVRPSQHYHPLSYRLIPATTDYYNFSFFPRAVFHWNNLPLETVACSTLDQFNQAVCKIDHVSQQKITILLLLNVTCFLTYFIFGLCILVTFPFLFFSFTNITAA